MSPSPLLLLTDTLQTDILGSAFPPSPLCLPSPQLFHISPLTVQTPETESFWPEPFLGADDLLKSELEGIPSYRLDREVVDNLSVGTTCRPG